MGAEQAAAGNLAAVFDEHVAAEFQRRDAEATMLTMTEHPVVNHVPVMTGGVGYEQVYDFYRYHFIPKMPDDISLRPVSRTVGDDQVVDEMVVSFTHNIEIDWLLPGVPATGKAVTVPLVVIVGFEGGRVAREHIYWDQATVLLQVGLLNANGLPVTGSEQAQMVLDHSLGTNALMQSSTS